MCVIWNTYLIKWNSVNYRIISNVVLKSNNCKWKSRLSSEWCLITAKISGLYGINSITIKMYGSYAAFFAFICKKDTLFLSSFDLNNALNRSNYYYHSITAQLSLSYHPLTVLCEILVCEKREEWYYWVNYISLCFVCTVCTVHREKNTEKKGNTKKINSAP